jgi:3-hydroxyisobutyrate dehydrogenase-like beta-hydroxyacid dehydrogenase
MVGIIGIGDMGGAIASTLARSFVDVQVYDTDQARIDTAVACGANAALNAAALVQACDPVMASLPSSEVLIEVAEEWIIPNARAGQTIIDLGTTVVEESRRICGLLKAKGAAYLDAPVSGGRIGSAQGALYVFVGGDRDAALKQWPLLSKLAKTRLTYCGPSGSGQIVKAVNQLAMGLVNAAYIECVAYGARAGVDPMVLMEAIGDKSGFRQQFAETAARVISGEGEALDTKYPEYKYFLKEADNVGFPAPLLRALSAWLHRFPETGRDNMGRPYPPYWSSLMNGKKD